MKNKIKDFWNKYGKIIKIIITLILISIIIIKVDLVESIKLFREVNLLILIPFFLYIPALLISTLKWKISLEKKENFWKLFRIYWISGFFSNFLPSTIGGDSYKVLKLRKKFGTKKVLESVIFDRFSGILGIIIVASMFSMIIFQATKNIYLFMFPIILLIGFLLFILSIHIFNLNNFKLIYYLKNSLIRFNKKLITLIPLSILFLILGAISLWIYYFMFGYNLNFLIVLSFYSIIQIINMLPISINSWGLQEGSMIYFFILLGVPAEVSLSIALLSRLVMVIQTGIGGFLYLFEKEN